MLKHILFGCGILLIILAGCTNLKGEAGFALPGRIDTTLPEINPDIRLDTVGDINTFNEIIKNMNTFETLCTDTVVNGISTIILTQYGESFTRTQFQDRCTSGTAYDFSCDGRPHVTTTICESGCAADGVTCVVITGGTGGGDGGGDGGGAGAGAGGGAGGGGGAASPCKNGILNPGEQCDDGISNNVIGPGCPAPQICNAQCACVALPSTSCTDSDFTGSRPKYGSFDSSKSGKASAVTSDTSLSGIDLCGAALTSVSGLIEYRCNQFGFLERFVVACSCQNGVCT